MKKYSSIDHTNMLSSYSILHPQQMYEANPYVQQEQKQNRTQWFQGVIWVDPVPRLHDEFYSGKYVVIEANCFKYTCLPQSEHSIQMDAFDFSNLKITMGFSIGIVSVFLFSFYWMINLSASVSF